MRIISTEMPFVFRMKDPDSILRPEKEILLSKYHEIRQETEKLCAPLKTEDYVIQSMPDASPAKWHLAHTTWFFEAFFFNKLLADYVPFERSYDLLFNSYYQSIGKMYPRGKRGLLSRPTVEEIYDYRKFMDEHIRNYMESVDEEHWLEAATLLELGLHHEQQHQELLLTDLKHMLSAHPAPFAYTQAVSRQPGFPLPPMKWIQFSEGVYQIGHEGPEFAFDHEKPRHQRFIPSFQMGDRLVTNGEYQAFMDDGGYRRPEFWLSDGWDWLNREKRQAPLYWRKQSNQWFVFTLSGIKPVDEMEPVCHVSYFEADAYARWAGARLPTEEEWETAAQAVEPVEGNFAEKNVYHPEPLRTIEEGLTQMMGDVWEWTASPYMPYPGYEAPSGALGEYNGKFMCNQYVLRGGSCATPQSHIRKTYRNFFAPDKSWQFTGIRLAKNGSLDETTKFA